MAEYNLDAAPDSFDSVRDAHVRPPDWQNPTPQRIYDLVVIGAGTAGLVSAAGAVGLGARVALVERHLMGGDCLNVGCVPSKAVIAAARAAAAARSGEEFGVSSDVAHVDFAHAMRRMRRLRSEISPHDSAARFRSLGVDVFFGNGSFVGNSALAVEDAELRFKRAVIATGARAAAPAIPGLADISYLTNESLFDLTELPNRLGIIGAGPIGCEMAQAFARLGSQVVLVESGDGVLPREDRAAANIIEAALRRDGVNVMCCGRDMRVTNSNGIRLQLTSHDHRYDEPVDEVLVAAGRTPNVEKLNLDAAGVEYDASGVRVDDFLRTTNRRIFAAGDICSPFKFTHAADFMARTVIRNALFHGRSRVSKLTIPWCTYTSPEVAHVGFSEREANRQGLAIDTFEQPMSRIDRAILDGNTEGFAKVIVKKGTDKILGATVVGHHAGELIGELSLAMTAGLGLKQLGAAIHPYPTYADALRRLGDDYNRSRLTPRVKKLLQLLLRKTW